MANEVLSAQRDRKSELLNRKRAHNTAAGQGIYDLCCHSKLTAVHHAFTSPKPEYLDSFDTEPGEALAYAYDIVCNGNEIGGVIAGMSITSDDPVKVAKR